MDREMKFVVERVNPLYDRALTSFAYSSNCNYWRVDFAVKYFRSEATVRDYYGILVNGIPLIIPYVQITGGTGGLRHMGAVHWEAPVLDNTLYTDDIVISDLPNVSPTFRVLGSNWITNNAELVSVILTRGYYKTA